MIASASAVLICALSVSHIGTVASAGAAPDRLGTNPNLKYFGFWQTENYTSELAGWANLLFFESNTTAFPIWRSQGFNILWNVEWNFFAPGSNQELRLRPDYTTQWSQVAAAAGPLLTAGTIFGFFLGDELIWNGLPYDQLVTATKLVRSTFPAATIYYNEAYPVFTQDVNIFGGVANYTAVPAALDWVSIDFYPVEGTFANAQQIYQTLLYPKMAAQQRVLYVPPAYGTVDDPARYCGNADCATAMVQWASESYSWAQSDEKFVGLNPWHWHSYPESDVPGFEIGARDMPSVVAAWKQIGDAIIAN